MDFRIQIVNLVLEERAKEMEEAKLKLYLEVQLQQKLLQQVLQQVLNNDLVEVQRSQNMKNGQAFADGGAIGNLGNDEEVKYDDDDEED